MTNIDKISIILNISKSTSVQTTGSNKVNIRTQGQENWRITEILVILASWVNIAPLLIFKEKEGIYTESKL